MYIVHKCWCLMFEMKRLLIRVANCRPNLDSVVNQSAIVIL
jgi:hypothetical protein